MEIDVKIKKQNGEVETIKCGGEKNNIMRQIKEARKAAGLSQQKMSDALGIPRRTIEQWETGKRSCPEWAAPLKITRSLAQKTCSLAQKDSQLRSGQ